MFRRIDLETEDTNDIVKYLTKRGKITQTTLAQMYKARFMYTSKGYNEKHIAETLGLSVGIINAWIVQFDWKESRNKRLFEKFANLQEIRKRKAAGLDERHDRIAQTLEDTLENILETYSTQGEMVNPKDLSIMTKTLKDLQEIRRTSHAKDKIEKKETKQTLILETGDNFNKMASMLSGMFGAIPQLESEDIKQIEAEIKDVDTLELDI